VPRGLLVAFEGLDQSGKQTQAERLRDFLAGHARQARLISFPDYSTPIGREIGLALRGERSFGADVMQLLYVANRHEHKPEIEEAMARGEVVVCDRYLASSIAYGEAQSLDPIWLREIQRFLPQPDVTVLLDIAPEVSARRKTHDRDKYEQDLSLLGRVRASYLAQAAAGQWVRLDADQPREVIAAAIAAAVTARL
jgi:dTMP kinase